MNSSAFSSVYGTAHTAPANSNWKPDTMALRNAQNGNLLCWSCLSPDHLATACPTVPPDTRSNLIQARLQNRPRPQGLRNRQGYAERRVYPKSNKDTPSGTTINLGRRTGADQATGVIRTLLGRGKRPTIGLEAVPNRETVGPSIPIQEQSSKVERNREVEPKLEPHNICFL